MPAFRAVQRTCFRPGISRTPPAAKSLATPVQRGRGAENKPAARGDSDHLHPKAHVHFIVECLVERQIGKHVESNHVHL